MNYSFYIAKRKLEQLIIAPFIAIGYICYLLKKNNKQYDIYFFFPFYHIGGAEKIHLQIAALTKGKKAVIVFTRKSNNEGFLNAFKEIGIDIEYPSAFTNNGIWKLPFNLMARGYYAGRVNNNKAIVFNGQCNFGYKIAPWLHPNISQFELIHSFNSFSWIRIPFANYYTKTVMISQHKIQAHFNQYDKIMAPTYLKERILYIPNAVEPITNGVNKIWEPPYHIIYVGRGSEEKRIPAIMAVAQKAFENQLPFSFELIGDVENYINSDANKYVNIAGMISKKELLVEKYQSAQLIILLSSTEGMPLVVLEAMQNHCIPIVTAVGDLPLVINKENGFLIENHDESVIEDAYAALVQISTMQKTELEAISTKAAALISQQYSLEAFNKAYQALLNL